MGIYGDYLNRALAFDFQQLAAERKAQLARIAEARGRDVLVFAADCNKQHLETSIGYWDVLPINDQLANLNGAALDLIVETPGGSGEIVEQLLRLIRNKYDDLAIIVPGQAKSAGTIMAMMAAEQEILMGEASALGPIDAQLFWQGKKFFCQTQTT